MKIESIELHQIILPLVHPFRASFGEQKERRCIIVSAHADGITGWGECATFEQPYYSEETTTTAWYVLENFLAPPLVGYELHQVADIFDSAGYKRVCRHNMAKAALENAVWDLFARRQKTSLKTLIGGAKERVEVGVSIGIQPSLKTLLDSVDAFVNQGYRRVKIKIEPGWDIEPLTEIRKRYPELKLMADANSAYTLDTVERFKRMEDLKLLMIEQPLASDDFLDHAALQAQLETPVCLDESICSIEDARISIKLKACRVINIKPGRVGGLTNAIKIHNLCAEAGIPVWCGGMLETGIGRAANLHLASLPHFTLPGDISASERYYDQDIVEPTFSLNSRDSTITVPAGIGIGVETQMDRLIKARERHVRLF